MLDGKRFTTIVITKTGHVALKGLMRKLKYESMYAMLEELAVAIDRANYSRFDLECLLKFSRIPEIIEGSARNEKDFEEKRARLGGPAMRKTGEIPDVEKVGKLSKGMLGEKDDEDGKDGKKGSE